jgi:hypothetical protein
VKALEQLIVRSRARWREERARRGLGGRPARLLVRVDDLDAPVPPPASTLKLDDWHEAIVRVVEWSGPLPVHIVSRAGDRLLPELVRFAHRLECPTTLRTCAAGLSPARAEELVDCGVDRVLLRVAAFEDGVQGAVLGESAADARAALAALAAARASRGAALDIVVEVPFDRVTVPLMRATFDEARRLGADGGRLVAPWSGGPWDAGLVDAAAAVLGGDARFDRTSAATLPAVREMRGDAPGTRRTRGACPVGTLQVELLRDGSIRACPFKEGAVPLGDAMQPAWQGLASHRAAVSRCDRSCAHPEVSV